jgi:hypothetical protein
LPLAKDTVGPAHRLIHIGVTLGIVAALVWALATGIDPQAEIAESVCKKHLASDLKYSGNSDNIAATRLTDQGPEYEVTSEQWVCRARKIPNTSKWEVTLLTLR